MLADDMLSHFENPSTLWTHAFDNLSKEAQTVFCGLVILGGPCSLVDLEATLVKARVLKMTRFQRALSELDDSFTSSSRRYSEEYVIDFYSPALQDFAEELVMATPEIVRPFLTRPVFSAQPLNILQLASSSSLPGRPANRLSAWVSANPQLLYTALVKTMGKQITFKEYFWQSRPTTWEMVTLCKFILNSYEEGAGRKSFEKTCRRFFEDLTHRGNIRMVRNLLRSSRIRALLSSALNEDPLDAAINWATYDASTTADYDDVADLLNLYESDGPEKEAARRAFEEYLEQRISELSRESDSHDFDEELSELRDIADRLGCDITPAENAFEERILLIVPDDDDFVEGPAAADASTLTERSDRFREDAEIDSLFESLRDGSRASIGTTPGQSE